MKIYWIFWSLFFILLPYGSNAVTEAPKSEDKTQLPLDLVLEGKASNVSVKNDNISEELKLKCGAWDSDVQSKVNSCSFWMEGVILSITGTIGLMGNILSIIILSKPDMYNSFNQLLIGLSTMDSIFIVLAILDYSLSRAFKWSSQAFVYSFPFIIYPLNNISFCGSIFTTIALAYERYIAVCRPLHYRDVTARYTIRRRTLSYALPVLLISVALSVPKFLETRFVWTLQNSDGNETENGTMEWIVSLGVSDLRSNPDYIRFYINWTRLITTGVAPMVALIYFNSNIFRGIQMTHERTRKRNKQRASEMNLAAILLCIVILFLICHFPRILLNVHEFFMLDDMILCGEHGIDFTPPVWFLCFTSFNHSLLIVNASCNFLIYCSVGAKFKRTIAKIFYVYCDCCAPTAAHSPTTVFNDKHASPAESGHAMTILAKPENAVCHPEIDIVVVEVNVNGSAVRHSVQSEGNGDELDQGSLESVISADLKKTENLIQN